jgi:hypothetical protein
MKTNFYFLKKIKYKTRTNSFYFNLISNTSFLYTQQLCLRQCIQKEVIVKCNCTDPAFVSFFKSWPSCADTFKCPNDYYNTLEFMKYVEDICVKQCPLECYHTLYKTLTYSFHLIGENYVSLIKDRKSLVSDFVNRTLDAYTAKESVVKVNIFYDSLSFIESTESPQMTLVTLLSSMSGNLGLFLGVSFFSICEIVEFSLEIYFERKKMMKRKIINFQ